MDPRLLAMLLGLRTGSGPQIAGPGGIGGPGENTVPNTLDDFALSHLSGYGQVDAPSPWGYNRDVFEAEHPNYQGGYYNPASGFYDAPAEVAFAGARPDPGPSFGEAPGPGAASGPGSPVGPGAAESYTTPVAQDASRGDNTQDQGSSQDPGTNFDMGSFLSALAAMGEFDQSTGAGDHDSSNVTGSY
jgi:hypothetical protein